MLAASAVAATNPDAIREEAARAAAISSVQHKMLTEAQPQAHSESAVEVVAASPLAAPLPAVTAGDTKSAPASTAAPVVVPAAAADKKLAGATTIDLSPATATTATAKANPATATTAAGTTAAAATKEHRFVSWMKGLASPEYDKWGKGKAVGVGGKLVWAGHKVFWGMDFIGEVCADFLGITDSKYQYVVDAYERHQYEMAAEKREEDAARRRRLTKEVDAQLKAEAAHDKKLNAVFAEQQQAATAAAGTAPASATPAAATPAAIAVAVPVPVSAAPAVPATVAADKAAASV